MDYRTPAVSFASLAPIRAVAKFFFEGDRKFFVKGVTYGPFKPDAEGHFLGPRDQVERDVTQMREAGLNVVRIYHVPPVWFLDCCAAAGMRVLITVPWAKHVEFLSRKASRDQIVARNSMVTSDVLREMPGIRLVRTRTGRGIRFASASSRRGDFYQILSEVRWELDIRGFEHVKILASGGIDEYEILKLNPLVDGYGVGTSIANAPVLSFALDIMEIEGQPMAKRGKRSGSKQVWRVPGTVRNVVLPAGKPAPKGPDGRRGEGLLKPLIVDGRVVRDLPPPRTLREYVLEQMAQVEIQASRERGLRADY